MADLQEVENLLSDFNVSEPPRRELDGDILIANIIEKCSYKSRKNSGVSSSKVVNTLIIHQTLHKVDLNTVKSELIELSQHLDTFVDPYAAPEFYDKKNGHFDALLWILGRWDANFVPAAFKTVLDMYKFKGSKRCSVLVSDMITAL